MAKYGLNKVTLIGNLGQDPEYRQLDNGVSVARINIACTESFPDRSTGTSVDKTEWFRVTLWRSQADIAHRYLRKGSSVFIEGRLRNHSWDTPQGEKRYSIEIDAARMILLDRAPEGSGSVPPFPSDPSLASSPASYGFGSPAPGAASAPSPSPAPPEDDLPF
jgi:single-strand DNA-binding protein